MRDVRRDHLRRQRAGRQVCRFQPERFGERRAILDDGTVAGRGL